MLEIARTKSCRFILASTSEVYGDPKVNPQSEDYWGNVNPIGPRSVYDEGKRYAEALTMAYYRNQAVEIKIARIFNTYGPRMRIEVHKPDRSVMSPTRLREFISCFNLNLRDQ